MIGGLAERLGLRTDTASDRLTPKVQMGIALAASGKPTYAGTVPHAEVRRRRAKNRRAAASRRTNRGRR